MNDLRRPTLREQLLLQGRRSEFAQGILVAIHADIWFVERGHVDVFLIDINDEFGVGARTHLFACYSGQILSLPELPASLPTRLTVVPAPGAEVITVPRACLLQLLDDEHYQVEACAMLQTLAVHASTILPKCREAEEVLLPGHVHASHDQAVRLSGQDADVWAVLEQGSAAYRGDCQLEPMQPVPLTAGGWIELAPQSGVSTLNVFEVAVSGADRVLAGVEALLSSVIRFALTQRQREADEELDRLSKRAEISNRHMSDALDNFVSIFHARPNEKPNARHDDRVLSALSIIGDAQGIQFKAAPPPADGVPMHDPVRQIAQASGVRTRVVTLRGEWWLQDNGPILVVVEATSELMPVLPLRSGGYEYVDPLTGHRGIVTANFAESLSPFGFTFYSPLPSRSLTFTDILKFLSAGMKRDFVLVLTIALVSAALSTAIPLATGYLFNTVYPAADQPQMLQVVAILFTASLVTLLLETTRSLTMLRIESRASNSLQAAVWDRVLTLPVPFFRDYSSGDLATRINGVNSIRQALAGNVVSTLISSTFSILNVVLLFYYSAKLAFVAIGLVLVAAVINGTTGILAARIQRKEAHVGGEVAGVVLEYLSGIAKLRITGAERRAFARWAARFGEQKRFATRNRAMVNIGSVFSASFPVISNAAIFACLGVMLADKSSTHFSTGDFIAFNAAWTAFLTSALALVGLGTDLVSVSATYQRVKPILDATPEIDENKAYPGNLMGSIELSNVSFAYAADTPPILDNISMSIKPGEFIALVGSSGSGKSTLLRLMLGFEQPLQGAIYYDGQNLAEVDIGAVRRQLGVVLQSGKLMSGDIYSNIVGASARNLEDAWAAARACGLDKDIEAMPMGMHTMVADGGGTLSGGQRQRLLIARAIVNKPRIIFFDEATSALDNRSQAIVSESMEKLQATRIVIAHRLSTILNADRIYVLDKGKIVQSGTYEQLLEQRGLFADLAKRQMT